MMPAEDELRRALRRVEPPSGFADRVIAMAASGVAPRRARLSGWAAARLAAAAVLAVAIAGGVIWYRGEQRRQAGEEARRQVLLSLRIAGEKLQLVRALVNAEPN
jgi:hypothetical protein